MGRLDKDSNLISEVLLFAGDGTMVECYVFDGPVTVEGVSRMRGEMHHDAMCGCHPEAETRDFGDDVVLTAAKVVHPADCRVAETLFKFASDRAAAPNN